MSHCITHRNELFRSVIFFGYVDPFMQPLHITFDVAKVVVYTIRRCGAYAMSQTVSVFSERYRNATQSTPIILLFNDSFKIGPRHFYRNVAGVCSGNNLTV